MTRPVEFFKHTLGAPELASLKQTLDSLFLTLGPRVAQFERAFAEYLEVDHVVGTTSCSVALLLALRAIGVQPGDEVITTPMTFVATPNAVLLAGATPVFVDIDPTSGHLDPSRVEAAVNPRTRAIISVGLYGQLVDMRALRAIADRHGLRLIDDAAHAVEARRDGYRTAALADLTAFSFYATKNITCGDGGALAVHDAALAAELRNLRNHGITKDAATRYGWLYTHWDMVELGYKAALTDIQAAILLPQLARIEAQRDRRAAVVERYTAELRGHTDIELIARVGESAHHIFALLVPAELRDGVLAGLGRRRIGCGVNYRSVHTLEFYRERFGYQRAAFPHAADFGERTVSLPLWPDLPLDDVTVVVDALGESLEEARQRAPQVELPAAPEVP